MPRPLRPGVAVFGVLNLACAVLAMELRSWKLMAVWIGSYVLAVALALIFPEAAFQQNGTPEED